MLTTTAVETAIDYVFTVTDGTNKWVYRWGKQPSSGQTIADYLQTCKTESERLAQLEIDQNAEPTPVTI